MGFRSDRGSGGSRKVIAWVIPISCKDSSEVKQTKCTIWRRKKYCEFFEQSNETVNTLSDLPVKPATAMRPLGTRVRDVPTLSCLS